MSPKIILERTEWCLEGPRLTVTDLVPAPGSAVTSCVTRCVKLVLGHAGYLALLGPLSHCINQMSHLRSDTQAQIGARSPAHLPGIHAMHRISFSSNNPEFF